MKTLSCYRPFDKSQIPDPTSFRPQISLHNSVLPSLPIVSWKPNTIVWHCQKLPQSTNKHVSRGIWGVASAQKMSPVSDNLLTSPGFLRQLSANLENPCHDTPCQSYYLQRSNQQWFCAVLKILCLLTFLLAYESYLDKLTRLAQTFTANTQSSNQSASLKLLTQRPVDFTLPHRTTLDQAYQLWESLRNPPAHAMHLSWQSRSKHMTVPWHLSNSFHVSFHWKIRIGCPCQAHVDLVYGILLRFYLL